MIDIESGDVLAMRDSQFNDLLDEINHKQAQLRYAHMLGLGGAALGILAAMVLGQNFGAAILIAIPAYFVGAWLDSFKRVSVLFYDLEDTIDAKLNAVTGRFDELMQCVGKWHIEASGQINDLTTWKRNAGASSLVRRKSTLLAYKLPRVIRSNFTPPSIGVGKQTLYFFPDVVFMEDKGKFGAISYSSLEIAWRDSRFIETDSVPRDATVVDHTWQYPNKKGGPDRRYKNNKKLPVCLYETMILASHSGVREMVEFSKTGHVEGFANALKLLAA